METQEKYIRFVKDKETKEYVIEILDTSGFKDYDELDDYLYGENPDNALIMIEDDLDNCIAVEHNGDLLSCHTWPMLEEELEEPVVEALKKDKIFVGIEYAEDPEDDDTKTTIQVFEHLKTRMVKP